MPVTSILTMAGTASPVTNRPTGWVVNFTNFSCCAGLLLCSIDINYAL